MQSKKQNLEKNRKVSLNIYMTVIAAVCLYAGLHLGVVYRSMEQPTLFGAVAGLADHMMMYPLELYPTDGLMVGILLFIGVMINLYLYNEYLKVSHTVNDAHGDAAFEDNLKQYNKEFVYNPKVVAAVEGKSNHRGYSGGGKYSAGEYTGRFRENQWRRRFLEKIKPGIALCHYRVSGGSAPYRAEEFF